VDRAAEIARRVGVQVARLRDFDFESFASATTRGTLANCVVSGCFDGVRERRILLAGLVVGQRVIHDRMLGDFRQRDVPAHVVQVRAVVLAHDEELAAVAEHGRTDAALLEPRVLLNDGNVPAIELASWA
jgi:hypothetical protein